MFSFYLRRSLQRRPLRHLSLFWIMLCAFLLPLVVMPLFHGRRGVSPVRARPPC